MPAPLHHVTHGDPSDQAPVLVAVHGMNVDHRMMEPVLEPLVADLGLVRHYVDLPGHGESSGEGVRSAEDAADALDAWVSDTLGETPFLLAGQSFGGLLCREVLRRRGAQVRGLALIAPVAEAFKADRDLPDDQVLERDDDLLAELDEKKRSAFQRLSVVQTRPVWERFAAEHLPGSATVDDDVADALGEHPGLGEIEWGSWEGPSVIVCGRQDSVVGWEDQARLLDHYPRATFAALDGAGHNVHLERPDATGVLLADWVSACLRDT